MGPVGPSAGTRSGLAIGQSSAAIDRAVLDSLRQLQEPDEPDLIQELSVLFVTETSARLECLAIAARERDGAEIGRQAHGLKGSVAMFGASPMARLCAEIEVAEIAGDSNRVSALVGCLRDEFARVQIALSDILGGR